MIVAAVDDSAIADRITLAAARLASIDGRAVHVVHAQESVIGADSAIDGETAQGAKALVAGHLRDLEARKVAAYGQVLLHAPDHGGAGRLIAEYANSVGAMTIVVGAPTHGGLPALMDASASQELLRHARSNIVIVNPQAPRVTESGDDATERVSDPVG